MRCLIMIKNFKKGQAALEFLTTYGWAFLVILIMVGALSYFGVFDVGRFVPDNCKLDGNIECEAFSITLTSSTANDASQEDVVGITIKNNRQESIAITGMTIVEKDDTANPDVSDGVTTTLALAQANTAGTVTIAKGDTGDAYFWFLGNSNVDNTPGEKKSYEVIVQYTVGTSTVVQRSSGIITGVASN